MKYSLVLCLMLGLAACSGGATTRYHTLTTNAATVTVAANVSQRVKSLGVGPVDLPTLLDREGMVIRQDATTVDVSDTELWGGQLEDEFLRALTQQLQLRLPVTRLQTIPWELSQTPQYQVVVRVDQFDGMPAGKANLRGLWQLQNGTNGTILATEPVALEQVVTENSVDAVVRAQSALVGQLAAQMIRGMANYAK